MAEAVETPVKITAAVLGTGTMGAPMARNLAAEGHSVRAWNRTRHKAEPLTADGVEVMDTPAEAARGADVVVTMTSDADAVLASMGGDDGALGAMEGDAAWAQMATVGIAGLERCQVLADEAGVPLVDAPVLGTREPAERAELVVLAAGPDEPLDRCAPVFGAVGARTVRLGEAGEATRLKVVLNHWLLALVEGLGETVALAEGIDVDPRRFLELIEGGPLDSPYAQLKGAAMVSRELPASFALEHALKDAELVREAADRHALALPLIDTVAAQLRRAADAGHGRQDLAATVRVSSPRG